jgi:hypothetical protein
MNVPKVQRVTYRLAKEFATMDPAPSDRPMSERRLNVYDTIVKRNEMRVVTWAKAHCAETGGTYRVNGKHTSTLYNRLAENGELDKFVLHVLVEEYQCDTLEDVARLYGTFDSKLGVRTAADINASFAASVPELAVMSRRLINLAVAGICYHKNPTVRGGGSSRESAADRAEVLLDETKFVVWLGDMVGASGIESKTRRHLARASVVAAMMGCWNKAQKPCDQFWTEVRDGTGATPDVPSRKLEKFLLTHVHTARGNQESKNARFKVGDKEMYVKCIHAWNAWRKQEGTNLHYYHDKPVPAFA